MLCLDDLVMLRPGDGISPMDIDNIIGKILSINLEKGTMLKWEHFQK
jgi:sialic acid synthase SpsE